MRPHWWRGGQRVIMERFMTKSEEINVSEDLELLVCTDSEEEDCLRLYSNWDEIDVTIMGYEIDDLIAALHKVKAMLGRDESE